MAKATYKDAGVDLEIYRQSMARLPRLLSRTYSPRVIPLKDGFAGLFQLDFTNQLFARHYKEPVLVSCTDGVGTKLKVAVAVGRHDTVGIDLVAMSVNDALCCGAEPLFFLDYVAMPKDDPAMLEAIVDGITQGCIQADCALLGGETAILPDIYAPGDYDLAGFCVGVAERERVIDGRSIEPDDVVIGVASTGLHSNGYSLARRIVFDIAKLNVGDYVEELGRDRRRRPVDAHSDLRPPGAKGVDLLSREERGSRHRPHHRRRPARKPRTHLAARHPSRDRPRQLADAAGLPLVAASWQGRSIRNGPGLQHGRRPRPARLPLLRREHSPSTGRLGFGELRDRPRPPRSPRRRLVRPRRPLRRQVAEKRKGWRCCSSPKGFRRAAQGCRAAATLGRNRRQSP